MEKARGWEKNAKRGRTRESELRGDSYDWSSTTLFFVAGADSTRGTKKRLRVVLMNPMVWSCGVSVWKGVGWVGARGKELVE